MTVITRDMGWIMPLVGGADGMGARRVRTIIESVSFIHACYPELTNTDYTWGFSLFL